MILNILGLLVIHPALGHRAQDDDQHQNAQDLEQSAQEAHPADFFEYLFLGNEDGHGPAGAGNRGIIHRTGPLISRMDGYRSPLAGQHSVDKFAETDLIFHLLRHLMNGELHGQAVDGAHHHLTFAAYQNAVCIGIDIYPAHVFGKPFQRNIGRNNGGGYPIGIQHGPGIGGHLDIAAVFVQVRLRPVAHTHFQRLDEPFVSRIIIFFSSQRRLDQFSIPDIRIGSIERKALAIARYQGHGGTHHGRMVLHNPAGHIDQAVGVVQTPLGNPHVVPDGLLCLLHHVHNLIPGGAQHILRLDHGFPAGAPGQKTQLHNGRSFQNDGSQKNQGYTTPGILSPFFLEEICNLSHISRPFLPS